MDAADLLISQDKFDAWFDLSLPTTEHCNNIGRQVLELALQTLPNYVLNLYCDDLANNLDHASSSVYNLFSKIYSVTELETMGLWNALQAKVDGLGGCQNVGNP